MKIRRYIKYIILLMLASTLVGCADKDSILYTIEDLNGSHIAILGNSISEEKLEELFPDSEIVHFKSSSEFLLALSIGKCDAGVAERVEGEYLLSRNRDYASFTESGDGTKMLIVHRRLLPGRNISAHDGDFLEKSLHRINRSIISDGYWKLILKGFGATVTIFLLGITLAFFLAVLMSIMNSHRYLRYFSEPISWFIRTIHDVPSVVLIFFFYYIVFAYSHVSGIIVCAISLGVYSSGSLMNIFSVHLKQIDPNQHAAA